jgi:hypothetical protein
MPAKQPNKRNPTDATLRNVRATAKRFTALAQVVMSLDRDMTKVLKRLNALEGRGKRR